MPGEEALSQPGKKDGEVKVINSGNIPMAYSWSAADQKWNKIGSVIGSNDSNVSAPGKQVYNGKVNKRFYRFRQGSREERISALIFRLLFRFSSVFCT